MKSYCYDDNGDLVYTYILNYKDDMSINFKTTDYYHEDELRLNVFNIIMK